MFWSICICCYAGIFISVSFDVDSSTFAFLQILLISSDVLSFLKSIPSFALNWSARKSIIFWSKSSPQMGISICWENLKYSSPISSMEYQGTTSKIKYCDFFIFSLFYMLALLRLVHYDSFTSNPAIFPASFCSLSLRVIKISWYSYTFFNLCSKKSSASFSFCRIFADISCGEYHLSFILPHHLGKISSFQMESSLSFLTSGSSHDLPINLLLSKLFPLDLLLLGLQVF